jgi:hypothetical protein
MQTYELVMVALIGTTLFIGFSAALYSTLPCAAMDYASRHGRYAGLGKPDRLDDDPTAGNAPVTVVAALLGQSA